ncbi:MAG: class I SAM-dependent methyltransferase [Candidatus Doudnabacteria bacterium]
MKDKITQTLEAIEKAEGVWEQNENWENTEMAHDWGMKTKYASIPRSTGLLLKNLVERYKPQTVLEIGSSVGYSTLWILKGLLSQQNVRSHIYASEINTLRIVLAREHFKMAGAEDRITLFDYDAKIALQSWPKDRSIDFVFLDAFKRDYSEYLNLLIPLLSKNGIIVIDHINTHANLLHSFLSLISLNTKLSSEIINKDNGLMIIKQAG